MAKRPKSMAARSTDLAALADIASARTWVTFAGKRYHVDAEQALEMRRFTDAFQGKLLAAREVLSWIEGRDLNGPAMGRQFPEIVIDNIRPIPIDEAALLLGIVTEDPARTNNYGNRFLQIEPWAARAGLNRGKRWDFDTKALRALKLQVRDPESVSWPGEPGHG